MAQNSNRPNLIASEDMDESDMGNLQMQGIIKRQSLHDNVESILKYE